MKRTLLLGSWSIALTVGLLGGMASVEASPPRSSGRCLSATTCHAGFVCKGQRCVEAPVVCQRRCTWRGADGRCNTYGDDFCGPDARCNAYCETRTMAGGCIGWERDVCGPSTRCASRCETRTSSGECMSWGDDV